MHFERRVVKPIIFFFLKIGYFIFFCISGEIRTVVSLDRESEEYYNVEVEAVDQGTPRLTSTATLNIQVKYL